MIGIFTIIIALFVTVFVHELAHMFVALACGVKVTAFSIGFGKILLHKKLWNIDFRLSLIPLGGYCRLQGEKSKVKEGWLHQRYYKKVLISIAGVTANFLLACLIYQLYYKSISFGLKLDWDLMKAVFAKDYMGIIALLKPIKINIFIIQMTLMNLFAAITNIIPFPSLDGGFLWLFPLERFFKEKFPLFLAKITRIGFVTLMILQVLLLYWIWVVK